MCVLSAGLRALASPSFNLDAARSLVTTLPSSLAGSQGSFRGGRPDVPRSADPSEAAASIRNM
jgi:hypothetical protein